MGRDRDGCLLRTEYLLSKSPREEFPRQAIYDDVCTLTKETLIKDGVITHDGTIDIISGGYPCQPFSLAGKQRGEADERYLWGEFFRLVKEIRPTWVVGENVYGHVNNGLSVVVSDLEGEGYEVRAIVLPAADVGAPHKRERVFVVACHPDRQQSYKKIRPLSPSEENGKHGKVLPGSIGENFPNYIGQYPNPEFVEWMMGLPKGWTEID